MQTLTWQDPRIYELLTPDERMFVDAMAMEPGDIWDPLPGPQTLAFYNEADIIGYGGAGGGGKTDLAIGKALRQHRRTGVYRVNGTEHPAFIDRIEEVLGTRDGFNSKDGIWRTQTRDGVKRQIELGSFPDVGSERKHRGRPHDLKVFDEAGEMREEAVRFLLAWLRSTVPGQRCQALLCFNPPTSAEGRWVIEFFAPWLDDKHPNPALPGELRYFASIRGRDIEVPNGRRFVMRNPKSDERVYDFDPNDYQGTRATEIIKPLSRTFIPARVTDNPYYSQGAYMSQLQALPEPLRSQMLNGDFKAGMQDDVWQLCPTAWVDAAMARWKPLDRKPDMDSLGIDVARGGADNTIIARRHDMWFDVPLVYPGTETPDGPTVMGLVMAASRNRAPQHIDVIGVGASPYDFLSEAKQPVVGVDVRQSATSTDKSGMMRFFNMRSQLGWKFREALDPANNTGIALPPDKRLRADLCAINWGATGKTIKVELRDDTIARIKRSPDWASAYFLGLMDTPRIEDIRNMNSGKEPYDPYAELSNREGVRKQGNDAYNPYDNMR